MYANLRKRYCIYVDACNANKQRNRQDMLSAATVWCAQQHSRFKVAASPQYAYWFIAKLRTARKSA